MKQLRTQRREVDSKALRYRSAAVTDYDQLITESTKVYDGDELKIVFKVLEQPPSDLLEAFRTIRYQRTERTDGLGTQSRVLGYQPRLTIRRDFCTAAMMAQDHPKQHETFLRYAQLSTEIYREEVPGAYLKQAALIDEKVRPEWRIPKSVFTSGIVNYDNPLHYHTDTGNFPDTWNAMYALTFDMSGGQLVLPEYRIGFSFAQPAFIIFPAQNVLHGVTPLKKLSTLAYRYSVVYYALRGMCHCLAPQDELARIQRIKTERELKRSGLKKWTEAELKQIRGKGEKAKRKREST